MVKQHTCSGRSRSATVLLAVTLTLGVLAGASPAGAAPTGPPRAVIVQAASVQAAADAVASVDGTVDEHLDIISAVAARVSPAGIATLDAIPSVHVTPDAVLHPTGLSFDPSTVDTQLGAIDPGADWSPNAGQGVGVALVDTGVADTPDLHAPRLVRSPDFSGENDGIDHFGHGTFMAGLIAGDGTASRSEAVRHSGVAPAATLVSVKVADRTGASSVSRVIAGMGWAVANRDTYNIGVLNLSFGLDTNLPYFLDPLDAAAEAAWASGITVVAAAGNSGTGGVSAPGDDPFVISVGATDTAGTVSAADDTVPAWSSHQRFFGYSKPDILAPGVSTVSLRSPGSTIDMQHPDARVGTAYFRGTGTSMSTAIVSGAAAVLLANHGDATPDDVKGAFGDTAVSIGRGAQELDLAAANDANATSNWWQRYPLAFDGLGRGWRFGMPWTASRWRNDSWTASRWKASRWKALQWTASRWKVADWSATDWAASRWKATSWTADNWASQRWG